MRRRFRHPSGLAFIFKTFRGVASDTRLAFLFKTFRGVAKTPDWLVCYFLLDSSGRSIRPNLPLLFGLKPFAWCREDTQLWHSFYVFLLGSFGTVLPPEPDFIFLCDNMITYTLLISCLANLYFLCRYNILI